MLAMGFLVINMLIGSLVKRVGYILDERDLRKLWTEAWVCSRRVPLAARKFCCEVVSIVN
jgi:hypothetical protein